MTWPTSAAILSPMERHGPSRSRHPHRPSAGRRPTPGGLAVAVLAIVAVAVGMLGVAALADRRPSPSGAAAHSRADDAGASGDVGATGASAAGRSGLDWITAPDVARPARSFAGPAGPVPATPAGPGTAGHPGHFPGQAFVVDAVPLDGSLVAVGYAYPGWTAMSWSSTDGLTWELTAIGDRERTFAVAVAARDGLTVAVGRESGRPRAWTSADGRTWTARDVPTLPTGGGGDEGGDGIEGGTAERMTAVLATDEGFLAAGSAGPELGEKRARFWWSADGSSWQPAPDSAGLDGAEPTALAPAPGGGYVAVGVAGPPGKSRGSIVWVSADGRDWRRTAIVDDGRMVAVATALDGDLVAVGSDLDEREAVTWRSSDGIAWVRTPSEPSREFGGRKIRMTDVTATPDGWLVAVGNRVGLQFGTATTWRSRDGVSWERSPDDPALEQGEMDAVTVTGDGRLVAVGTFGAPDNYVPRVWLSGWGDRTRR